MTAPRRVFVAIDQEGGKVQRLRTKNGHKSYPSARSFGRKGSLEKDYDDIQKETKEYKESTEKKVKEHKQSKEKPIHDGNA